jgi:hypothetical protein
MVDMRVGKYNHIDLLRPEAEIFVYLYIMVFFVIQSAVYQYLILPYLKQVHAARNLAGSAVYS